MGCQQSQDEEDSRKQLDVQILLKSIENNIRTDYEQSYSEDNLQNIINLFSETFSLKGHTAQIDLYQKLKQNISNQEEKDLIEYLETKRSKKYSEVTFPESRIESKYRSVDLCPTTDHLRMSRIIHKYSDLTKQTASIIPVVIGKSEFFLKQVQIQGTLGIMKKYLHRKKKNSDPLKTPWIVEQTKDLRYVWRGVFDLDKQDVLSLLKFIFKKRDQNDQCPSILINAGSHGGKFGKNAHQTGNFQLTEIRIFQEMVDIIAQLLEDKSLKIRPENVKSKIYIHKLSSSVQCIYSPFADHIIDVQCCGAYEKVSAQNLVPKGAKDHREMDLLFLDTEQKNQTSNNMIYDTERTKKQSSKKYEQNQNQVQELNFAQKYFNDKSLKTLIENGENFPNLKKIILSHNEITEEGLKTFLQKGNVFHNLLQLYLNSNQIGDEGFEKPLFFYPGSSYFSNLHTLDIGSNKITDEGMKDLVQWGSQFPNLIKLNLQFNLIKNQGLEALARNFNNFKNLRFLYLGWNYIGQDGDEGVKALADQCERFTKLQDLHFQSNFISDHDLMLLALKNSKFPSLKNVHVEGNSISSNGKKTVSQLGVKFMIHYGPQIFYMSRVIVTIDEETILKEMFENEGSIKVAELIYVASENNFSAKEFNKKCRSESNTLTVCLTEFNKKIGAFTPLDWGSYYQNQQQSQYKPDEQKRSFIFSLTHKDKFELQSAEKAIKPTYYTSNGPAFGEGCDLSVGDNAQWNQESYANICSSYYNENYRQDDSVSWERFCGNANGSNKFKIKEWEVWSLQFDNKKIIQS